MGRPEGSVNVVAAWWMIAAGLAAGAVLGTWSFIGPVAPPAGFADYSALPRRLARLAHVAAVALPALNLLYVPWIRRTAWGVRARRTGCALLLGGTVGLPAVLTAAVAWPAALYAAPLPVLALLAAVVLLAAGRLSLERSPSGRSSWSP